MKPSKRACAWLWIIVAGVIGLAETGWAQRVSPTPVRQTPSRQVPARPVPVGQTPSTQAPGQLQAAPNQAQTAPGQAQAAPGQAPGQEETAGAEAGGEAARDSGLDARIIGGVQAADTSISDIMSIIQAETGAQIIIGQEAQQKTANFNLTGNPTVREVLETVLPTVGLGYYVQDNGVILVDSEANITDLSMPELELVQQTFTPQYVDVLVLEQALNSLKSPQGTIVVDPDSQKIIVTDLPDVVEAMSNYVMQFDVPVETRIFQIRFGNAQEIADQLQGVISTAEGELIVDYRNNTIIIRDTVLRLDMAEAIINQLDVELKPAVIPLAFALPEDVMPLVEGLLTENGYLDFDPRTSRLIVQDIPSVIAQIKELVKLLDIPTQQVWIEVDIVRITNDKSLTMGVSADFGKDVGAEGTSSPGIGSASGSSSYFSFNPFLSTSGSGLSLLDVNRGRFRFQIDAMGDPHQ